jgi:hypothetical protein
MFAWARVLAVSSATWMLLGAESALARAGAVNTRQWNDLNLSPPCANGRAFQPFCDRVVSSRRTHPRHLVKLRDNFLPELQKSVDNL